MALYAFLIRSRCFETIEEIVKDIGVKMSKRKSTNTVLSFDDVLNGINDWLAEQNGENDELGDNLDELCGEEEELILTQVMSA